jgi:hypothetical protein
MPTIVDLDDEGNEIQGNLPNPPDESYPQSYDAGPGAGALVYALFMLFLALLIDLIGMASFAIPLIGDFADIVWAPVSAMLIYKLFGNSVSFAALGFFEELLPFTDLLPTATLAWLKVNWQLLASINWVHVIETLTPLVITLFTVLMPPVRPKRRQD